MPKLPYLHDELYSQALPKPLTGRQLDEVAFPLGGIGTGCISLGGWGQLRDFEIRNRPHKNFFIPQTFMSLRCRWSGGDVTRVLQGPVGGTWGGDGFGLPTADGKGLPHFRRAEFDGRYPVANVKLTDPKVPLAVELEAFNPFIPGDDRNSSLPAAILIYRLTNPTAEPVRALVVGNLTNIIGDAATALRANEARYADAAGGLWLGTQGLPEDDPQRGTMVLATTLPVRVVPRWPNQPWFSWLDHWWQAVAEAEAFPPEVTTTDLSETGSIGIEVTVPPGETVEVPVILAWHFPRVAHWHHFEGTAPECRPTWLNWYATQWPDAWAVAQEIMAHLPALRAATKSFRDTLYASTLPAVALDAVSSQISLLKTPLVLRLPDGTFYGFEGCGNTSGCCPGSCTHVWNYAQALPYLFPALQRSLREAEWTYGMVDDGYVTFRMPLPPETQATADYIPCADGQMGAVMQAYREWMVCGDDDWLRGIWPKAKLALEFAWKYWDADRDGVMEGMQHNTYDIEYYGPNTMMGSLYLGALLAGAEMAEAVGDAASAATYRDLAQRGAAWTDEHLFNGEYYRQEVRPDGWKAWPEEFQKRSIGHNGFDSRFPEWPKWQVGDGCLADQLIGQWYAEMLGLGKLYDPANLRAALSGIFEHNWKGDLSEHPNPMRIYAVGQEAGLLICTWPLGNRPGHPSVYGDEAWSGIEYQVASNLIYEGLVDEGLAIVKGVRDRYDGERRNPWDEIECGHYYARSMASYSVLLALAGLRWHGSKGRLTLRPQVYADDFRVFYSVGSGWGLVGQRVHDDRLTVTIAPRHGSLALRELELALPAGWTTATVTGSTTSIEGDTLTVHLPTPVTATVGGDVVVSISRG